METPTKTELVRGADLEIHDPAFFRDLLKAVSKITKEPVTTLDPEGIRVKQYDPSHVMLVDLFIPSGYFETYNVYEERTIIFNVDTLLKLIFKPGKMKGTAILMRIEAERIVFDIKQGGGRVNKTLPLIDSQEDPAPYLKGLSFNSGVKILTAPLIRTLEDSKTLDDSNNVLITFKAEDISFRGVDGDYVAENTYNKYADEILEYRAEGIQKAYYNVDCMLTLVKALKPISEALTLELATNAPIRITPELPDNLRLIYYLAPCTDFNEKEPKPEVEAAAPEIVYPQEDPQVIPEAIPLEDPEPEVPEPVPVDVEDPGAEGIPAEVSVPHEDRPSLGDLYLKYYAEALARHQAEAA
jgi:DNA polymerase III sliding clamp (beta) subunit (PCNA family)